MVQLDLLAFILAVVTAIVGGAISIRTSTPSRDKLLKDIEILERMSEFKVTPDEKVYLLVIRSSISRQLKDLAVPTKKYVTFAVIVSAVILAVYFILLFGPIQEAVSNKLVYWVMCLVPSLPVGYLAGRIPMSLAFDVANRKYDQAKDFLREVSDEVENWMPEHCEADAGQDEPAT